MPIYEFLCGRCNVLLNFFSSKPAPEARPACPRCGEAGLERRPARFAIGKRPTEGDTDDGDADDFLAGIDEERMERAMAAMSGEMENLGEGEEDPRAIARTLRRFGYAAGMELGPRMEEMLRRLESGEDPENLDEDFGDAEEGDVEEWFQLRKKVDALHRRMKRPRVDDTLYFLE
jgi:putative FmdB family regulatory protein